MTLKIVFDNPNKTYTPGQIVTGKVLATFSTEENVKGLEVKVTGLAHVHWIRSGTTYFPLVYSDDGRTYTPSYNKTSYSHEYEDKDEVFCYEFFAFGDGRTAVSIPPGRHEYPFQFTLPQGLPSSFIGSAGGVKYEVEASIKMSAGGSYDRYYERVRFFVNSILDLNDEIHRAAQPANVSESRHISFWCRASGPISVVLKTPKIGFVPGEYIPIEAEVRNNSSEKVKAVTFDLIQTFTYEPGSRVETNVLATAVRPGVERGDSKAMCDDTLRVPRVPPTGLGNCRIIDVQYSLRMHVKIENVLNALVVSTPIIIGTVPIEPTFAGDDVVDEVGVTDETTSNPSCARAPASNYDDRVEFSHGEGVLEEMRLIVLCMVFTFFFCLIVIFLLARFL